MNIERWRGWALEFWGNLNGMVRTVQEKGPKHFARPLAISGAVLYGAYALVYKPPVAEIQRIEAELASAQGVSQFTERYTELDKRLKTYYSALPNPKDRSTWLLETIRNTMKEEGIYFTSLSPVEERDAGGYILASITIAVHATYKQMASWIARMERSKYLLHITNLTLTKDAVNVGMNGISLEITTVMPKEGTAQ